MTSPAPGVYLPGTSAAPSARVSEAIGRPADRRTGTVVAFTAGVLTVSVGGGDPEDVGYLNSYSPLVGDVVSLIQERTTWLCIGKINDAGAPVPPNSDSVQFAGSSGSNNTGSYTDLTGVAFTFTKRRPETALFVQFAGSGYSGVAGSGGEYAVNIGGSDNSMAQFFFNQANVHHSWIGFRHVGGIPAGTFTVQGRFRLYLGAGPIQWDGNDRHSLSCKEVD